MSIIPASATRLVGRSVLQAKKNSPHFFFVGGIIGVVTSTVMACRATLKLSETLDEIQSDVFAAKELEDPKDKVYVYARAGLQLAKLYGPAVIVGGASIAALTGSHVQLTRRNSALMIAYASLQEAYDKYRERIQGELGESKELDVYHNAKDLPGKDAGKVADPDGWSPYARFFDETSANWHKDPELNRLFIDCQERYANHLLRRNGHVFLNEVYDALDLERTRAGAVVGWLYEGGKDGYISFGTYHARNVRFVNGSERTPLLDFNVDGIIYNLI